MEFINTAKTQVINSIALYFVLTFVLLAFAITANAAESSIEDLLNPEVLSPNEKIGDNNRSIQNPDKIANIDELLGPKEVFPFLPDNHRDSGTGKFNSF